MSRNAVVAVVLWAASHAAFAQEEGEAAPTPAPAAEAAPAAASGSSTPSLRVRAPREQGIFGTYRVRLSVAKPRFDDGLKFYDKLYGNAKLYPTIAADWFAWDWYATLGLSLRLGYYTADGYTAQQVTGKPKKDIEDSDIVKNLNGPTTLTLIPMQLALAAEFTPFAKKWLVIDGWIGAERLYWQEVRTGNIEAKKKTALIQATADADDSKDDALTNKGVTTSTTIGVAANILLNPLDTESAASMRGSLGLGYVYLSPFMEIVRTLDKKGVSFGRSVFGLGFTFESLN